MTKNPNQIIFFSSNKIRIFFGKKTITPPPGNGGKVELRKIRRVQYGWTVLLPKGIYVELNDRKKQEKEINYIQILWNKHMSNDKLFYKLVNSHRDCRAQKFTQLQVDVEMLQNSDAIAERWVRYFQNLSMRLESDDFNAKYQDLVQLDYNEFEDFCRNNYKTDTEFVSLELLDKLVCEMINGKSQEEQLLSAEHLRFGGPSLVYLLKSIFEKNI